ncbi:MAG: hypothetical protein BMS9Abin25_0700 [Gammaproteobacteria bacterium]|nr:MAG: hypothetical protein BMS9Abin25_0700 [Gammaproteobacteria bacterium]
MTKSNKVVSAIPVWKRHWFRVLSITIVIFVLVLTALPFVISNAMKSWLLENGADNVAIENIDFNPFTGTVAVYGLDVRIDDKPVISNAMVHLDVSLTAFFKKGVAIEAATIDKLEIDIEQTADGRIRIGSLMIDPGKATDEETKEKIEGEISWWLDLEKITLNESVVRYTSPQLTTSLFLDSISLQNLSTKPGDQSAKLDVKARVNESDIDATINLEQLTPEVKADGDISIQKIDLNKFSRLTTDSLNQLAAFIDLSGKFSVYVSEDSDINASYTGNTVISRVDVSSKDFAVTGTELKWDGTLSFSTQSDNTQKTIKIDGKLNANELALDLTEQNLSIRQQEISLNPQLSLQITDEATGLSGTTNVQARGILIKDTAKALTLLAIKNLDVNSVQAESLNLVKINVITSKETDLIQKQGSKKPAISIDETIITDLNYDGLGLAIQKVAMNDLTGNFVRENDGSIDVSNDLQTADKADTKKEPEVTETPINTEEAPSAGIFGIKIDEFTVNDNSTLSFTDKTVSPPFELVVDIATLKVTDIDRSKPDQPVAIKLNSKLNTYASLSIEGTVKPFKKEPGVDLKINLDSMNMVALSPYVISSTGYLIRSGQLDLDSTIVINNGSIDAKNTFFMKKLTMDEADAAIVKDTAGSIGMPLDRALGMLTDKNDNIKLEIPITGKLDEVDIGTGQIINTALKKATTAGMKTYLLYAFQPYGALIMAGQAVGKQAGKINLDPVFFEAGDSNLSSMNKDYLKKLGSVMQDKPKIDVQICAYTTAADLSFSKDSPKKKTSEELSKKQINKFLKLGVERQNAIKNYLISEFKIDGGRLITCAPEYDDGKDAKPRVELLI